MTFPFELDGGHIVALVDGHRLLVDTGCPTSFGRPGVFRGIAGDAQVGERIGPHTIDTVVDYIGSPLDGLIGMDLIRGRGGLEVEWEARRVTLGTPAAGGRPVACTFPMGVPMVDLTVDDTRVGAVVDTGAFVSYVASSMVASAPTKRTITDFHLSIGRYDAIVREIRQDLFVTPRTHDFAVTPPGVERLLSSFGAQAIIGTDLLRAFDVVGLDTAAGRWVLRGE